MAAVCRDCYTECPNSGTETVSRTSTATCPSCEGHRIINHEELHALTIAHLDCDAFYASVEKRDHPEFANKPLIIGHGKRGVVTTACYLARMSGVGSAMPIYKAKKLCPDAVYLPPDMKKYRAVSKQIRALMSEVTPLMEPLSVDEAFMDLSGTERLLRQSPALTLMRLANKIEQEIGISVSIGLAPNKFLAKLASDLDKPRGFTVIGSTDATEVLAKLPITKIWGVGKVAASKLKRDGLTMINQLQEMDEKPLIRRYGDLGQRLYRLSRGLDTRPVKSERLTKSVSSERTLNQDIHTIQDVETVLWTLSERVSADLKRKGLAGTTITLKLKTNHHQLKTRSHTITYPTRLADRLFETVRRLADELCDGTRWRLIGVGVSNLSASDMADPPDILEVGRNRRASAEFAMDDLRARFGDDSIGKGRAMSIRKSTREKSADK